MSTPKVTMDPDVKGAFREAIQRGLPILRPLISQMNELHWVWRRTDGGQWHGEQLERPSVRNTFTAADKELRRVSETFGTLFSARHPEHAGVVGVARTCSFNRGPYAGR